MSGVGSIVNVMSGRTENRSCVARTWQVSLEHLHLVDYEGNSAL